MVRQALYKAKLSQPGWHVLDDVALIWVLTCGDVLSYAASMADNTCLIFEELRQREHEQVIFCQDAASGLRAIIGIHNTQLGPALGGCRMYPYASERDALIDVLRLSRGMTYKAAASGLNLGGGKAVILGDPHRDKSEDLWRAFGRIVQGLNGRYITAADSGTNIADMTLIRSETEFVVGVPHAMGGSGDPAPVTALGVFSGLRAAAQHVFGGESLAGKRVSVQGCGAVGRILIEHLLQAGAYVIATDKNQATLEKMAHEREHLDIVAADKIYDVQADIFAPCALGSILNADTIPRLKCKLIAGAANNQLADEVSDGHRLRQRGIAYAPDFVLNAGGLINVAHELKGYDEKNALAQTTQIFDVIQAIFQRAEHEEISTYAAARQLAAQRIAGLASN